MDTDHECIVCGQRYKSCDACEKITSFRAWRTVACSIECYQTYLAYLDYRDRKRDPHAFADMVNRTGIEPAKLPAVMGVVYRNGTGRADP